MRCRIQDFSTLAIPVLMGVSAKELAGKWCTDSRYFKTTHGNNTFINNVERWVNSSVKFHHRFTFFPMGYFGSEGNLTQGRKAPGTDFDGNAFPWADLPTRVSIPCRCLGRRQKSHVSKMI